MTKKDFLKTVRASQFFPTYAPQVKRYYHKIRGIDGNGKALEFSAEDKKVIKAGILRLTKDLTDLNF